MDRSAAPPAPSGPPLLAVESLGIQFPGAPGAGGPIRAADGVSFTLGEGETLGLVGESGCGKSATALALLRLVPEPGRIVSGRILLRGRDLLTLSEREMCGVRGRRIGFVFQEPGAALNPVLTVGTQIAEGPVVHRLMKKKEALREAERLMTLVRIPDAARRVREYPHQMSGGMRQRVMIAIALACAPRLLMADEPTTGLDVTVQAQILDLLSKLQHDREMAMILVTHDLGVVATRTDEIIVMYAGNVVERAPTKVLFKSMAMPYTEALLNSMPRLSNPSHTRLTAIEGRPPDLLHAPAGCPFAPRCPYAQEKCTREKPPLVEQAPGHSYACWFPLTAENRSAAVGV
jgi:oligopeptide/dipeptide ABC transporter ATP-binding protein